MSAAPHLSLCMIVRDSAQTLAACLDSIRPWVDEMIVVDTGSEDDTRQIARDRGAQVFEFPWIDDFSAARNESLRHARGKWIFWMDSDDTIDKCNGRELRSLAGGPHSDSTLGYVVQVHCPAGRGNDYDMTVVDHVKLIRNDPRIRFEGRIHEQVLPSIRQLGGQVGWTDLSVVHSGADQSPEGKQRKIDRDLRLLELDLQERPNHPFVLFNLGMTYEDMGECSIAECWLRRCLACSNTGESHVRKAYALLVSCLYRTERLAEAREICQRGLQLFSDDRELLFRLGLLEQRAENLGAAISAYRQLLHLNGSRHFTSIDRGIAGYKARHNLALTYAQQGQHSLAELLLRQVLVKEPFFFPAARGLVESLLKLGRSKALELELSWWEQQGMPPRNLALLWAECHVGRGDVALAIETLRSAVVREPTDIALHERLCRLLFEHARYDEAFEFLQHLVRIDPSDASAWHNLGMVALQLSRPTAAYEYLQRSLQLRPNYAPTQIALNGLRRPGKDISAIDERTNAARTTSAVESLPTMTA